MRKKFNLFITVLLISFTSTYVYANEAENLANFIIRNHDSQLLPVVGNLEANITIVEFFDYRCGYCSKQANDFQKLLLETDNAKIIYLEWPIFGGISETAAKIALNIWKSNPNLYFEVHNEFMKLGTSIKESNIVNLLNNLNLNRDYTKLNTPEVKSVLQVINDYNPNLYIDVHVTDGAD